MKYQTIARLTAALAAVGFAHPGAFAQQTDFLPIAITPESYNQDVIVGKTPLAPLGQAFSTATIDGGTNNTGNTWYEVGYNTTVPTSGLPAAGTTWTHASSSDKTYQMAPSYVSAPNGILIDQQVRSAVLTVTAPVAYRSLSFVASGGNGGGVIDVVVTHADNSTETGQFNAPDWFGGANPAWIAFGRVSATSFGFDTQGSISSPGNPRLYSREITLGNTASPVTKIELKYSSGGANVHNGIFAISGQSAASGPYTPVAITGYNYDFIIEAGAPRRAALNATTATMDQNSANTGFTWYEKGLNVSNPRPAIAETSGLPAPGAVFTHANAPDHQYQMPPSYEANNAVFLNADVDRSSATITLATPVAHSALSFLAAAGNGPSAINLFVRRDDGNSEEFNISILDWFNGAPAAYVSGGRVSVDNGFFDNVGTANPRLFGIDIRLSDSTAKVTSIDLFYTGTTGRAAILALSGTTGGNKPFFTTQPLSVRGNPGETATITATVGGTEPITYQWQKQVDGNFVNVPLGGRYSADGSNLMISGLVPEDAGIYRLVATSAAGTGASAPNSLVVLSPLQDVTSPTDSFAVFGGSASGNEGVDKAVDNTTSKFLNAGSGATPYVGNVGLTVTPNVGRTIVSGLRVYAANDAIERDPIDYKLEGSNNGGFSWEVISQGPLFIPLERNGGGNPIDPLTQALAQATFPNTAGYIAYRLSFPNNRTPTVAPQIQVAEIELLGVTDTSGFPGVSNPASARVLAGASQDFTVTVTGNPAPTVKWQRLVGDTWTDLVEGPNVIGTTTTTLRLNNLTVQDSGQIRAVVSNSVGSASSAPATLRVMSSLIDVTTPGDTITQFGDTTIGAPNGPTSGDPAAADPARAINDSLTKYLNGGSGFNASAGFPPFGGPVGFIVSPQIGPTRVTAIRIYTADDNVDRDPADYKLEGSNDGETFTTIASGPLNLPAERNATTATMDPLVSNLQEIHFANQGVWNHYRVTFSTVKNPEAANSLQIAEIELLGESGAPTPNVSVVRNANNTITITFEGSLERTSSLTPPIQWTPVDGTGSVTVDANSGNGFFRAVFPQ